MLAGRLELFDVEDVEAFCARLLDRYQMAHPTVIGESDREDALAHLVGVSWELSLDFRPGESSFSKYLFSRLNLRLIDWIRLRFGRTKWSWSDGSSYQRQRPTVVSLDTPADGAGDGDDAGGYRLADALAGGGGDPADDRDSALRAWMLEGGDRQAARDRALVRDLAAREAARRSPRDEPAERAREARRLRILLVRRVADECAVTTQTARLWLAGHTRPGSPESRARLERVLAELELEPAA